MGLDFLDPPYGPRSINVVSAAINAGDMTVMPIYVGHRNSSHDPWVRWWTAYFDGGHDNNPSGYADWIDYRLNYIENQYSNSIGTIIKSIEIGAEEESGWDDHDGDAFDSSSIGNENTNPTWNGCQIDGASFAEFYISARNYIKSSTQFPDLEIISGGSFEKHEALTWLSSINGSTGEFLRGFIDFTITKAENDGFGKYDYLPETIGIHSYPGHFPPEYKHDMWANREWRLRLTELFSICDEFGYIPNFKISEYGFSALEESGLDNPHGPISNGSEECQAIYYLRSCLMNSTMLIGDIIGWKDSVYHQHYEDDIFCFYKKTDPNNDPTLVHRKIRDVARDIFGTTLGLGQDNTTVWIPFNSSTSNYDENKLGWCGWYTSTNTLWAAMWLFFHDDDYDELGPEEKSIEINGNFEDDYNNSLWHFDFTGTPQFVEITNFDAEVEYASGVTTVTIPYNPGPGVTHNPIFIKFEEK